MSCDAWLLHARVGVDALRHVPHFRSGGRAFANWLAALPFDWQVAAELGAALEPFRPVHTSWQLGPVPWTTPQALAFATSDLIAAVGRGEGRANRCLALYAVCNPVGDPKRRLLEDLEDVAQMAAHAYALDSEQVAFLVERPERAPPTGLSERAVLQIAALVLDPVFRGLGLARSASRDALRYVALRGERHELGVTTDAYANRLVVSSPWVAGTTLMDRLAIDFASLDELHEELDALVVWLPWEILRRRVLAGCAEPARAIGQLCASDGAFARRVAGGHHVHSRVLLQVARISSALAELVASNPAASAKVLWKLEGHAAPAVRAAAARNRARRS